MPLLESIGSAAVRAFGLTSFSRFLDPYFKYVSLLISGNGTNLSNNNTFIESSNSVQMTKYGNASQGSFTPFLENYSAYFDGNGDYITIPHNSAFNVGTGNFTIEYWVNFDTLTPNGSQDFQTTFTKGYTNGILLQTTNGTGRMQVYLAGGTPVLSEPSNPEVGVWIHYAIVRNGTTVTLYKNGVSVATGTSSGNVTNTNGIGIGANINDGSGQANGTYPLKGFLADLRYTTSAVYTSNFTPPELKLTAISGTALLTFQSNRFKDISSTGNVLTAVGNAKIVANTPYKNTPYDKTIHGGSLHFDGTDDKILIGDGVTTNPTWASWLNASGSKTGTIEAWVYLKTHATSSTPYMHRAIFDKGNTFLNIGVRETGKFRFYWYDGTVQNWIDSNSTINTGEWAHLAAVLNGSTVTLYVNGVNSGMTRFTNANSNAQVATNGNYNGITDVSNYAGGPEFYIGGGPSTVETQNYWHGYISNLRFVPGTQVYTANFTPPTSMLTAISGTALLFKGENASVVDLSNKTAIDTFGNAQILTSNKKYGVSSLYFDGSGDSLIVADSPLSNIGTLDFTVEGWFNASTWSVETMYRRLWASGNGTGNDMSLNIFSDGKLQYRNNDTVLITASSVMNINTWYHVAVVRLSGTTTIYLDGVSVGSTATNNNLNSANSYPMYIGNHPNLTATWNGYIDDFRITRYARYSTAFVPPVREFEVE